MSGEAHMQDNCDTSLHLGHKPASCPHRSGAPSMIHQAPGWAVRSGLAEG